MAASSNDPLQEAACRALSRVMSALFSTHGDAWGGRDLILSGSSTLTSTLLEHGLADEILLIVYPVLLCTGKRFFAEGTPPRSFELVSTKAFPSGNILNTYKVAAPLKTFARS